MFYAHRIDVHRHIASPSGLHAKKLIGVDDSGSAVHGDGGRVI
jgi:hypothetical protein